MDPTELAFAGIARQAELIRDRTVSSRELVDLYLERIERIEPRINAFRVVLAERAREEADEADRRIAAGESAPLLGVPIALKDEVDVAGELTTHGSAGFDRPASDDASQYRRLREAGAVLLGKTNLSEPGDLAVHRDGGLGRDAQPLGSLEEPGRLQRRVRGGGRGGPRRRGVGFRRRRVDPDPGVVHRPLRPEAAARQDQPLARAAALARALGDRPRMPPGRRHRALARRRRRPRARGRRHPAAAGRPPTPRRPPARPAACGSR